MRSGGLKILASGLLAMAGAALLGGWLQEAPPQWRAPEPDAQVLRGRFAVLQEGLRVTGQEQGKPDLALRRKRLLSWLTDLEAMRPKAVVLEDWMEGSSQEEARSLLEPLEASLLPLARQAARQDLQARFEAQRQQLQVDHELALLFTENANLILPLGLGPVAPGYEPGPALERAGFRVILRGGEQAHLDSGAGFWRWPYLPFQLTSTLGAVDLGQGGNGLPAFFECQDRWVPSLGLTAALLQADLSCQDLRFQWRGRRLRAVGLGGRTLPLDSGGFCYPDPRHPAAPMETVPLEPLLAGALGPARVAGKVVFFRPWALTEGTAGLADQEKLFAGLFSGSLKDARPGQWTRQGWLTLALAVALAACLLPFPWSLLPALALVAAAFFTPSLAGSLAFAGQGALAATLCGWGLRALFLLSLALRKERAGPLP